jgi:hypothetical protein
MDSGHGLKLVARDRVSRRSGRQSCPERRGPIESDGLGEDRQVVRVVEGCRGFDGAELRRVSYDRHVQTKAGAAVLIGGVLVMVGGLVAMVMDYSGTVM